MSELTVLFERIRNGDGEALEELLPIVYDELKQLARRQMARERPGNTLQTTALVHEAYLRLIGDRQDCEGQHWDGRGHFFTAAAEAMRRILVDRARSKQRLKRGGGQERQELGAHLPSSGPDPEEVVLVNDLLDGLAAACPEAAELFKLHYFAGFNISEAGRVMGIPSSTAHRHWSYARAWLHEEMRKGDGA